MARICAPAYAILDGTLIPIDRRIHARGEYTNAIRKTWKILTKPPCGPCRATVIMRAILVLHHVEHPTYPG
jgi:hypothetical protein